MLIIAIILLGMLAGFAARWIVGQTTSTRFSNAEAFAAGIGGSFVGGLLVSLIAGDGFDLRMSGLIGRTDRKRVVRIQAAVSGAHFLRQRREVLRRLGAVPLALEAQGGQRRSP